jgi:sulfopyruvate decarboxylase subunit beta
VQQLMKTLAAALRAVTLRNGPHLFALATEPDIAAVKPLFAVDPVAIRHRFVAAVVASRYISALFGVGDFEPA